MSRQEELVMRLTEALAPVHLEVINESHMHSVPKGSETHFKVIVASARFDGKSRVERHRAVQRALDEAFRAGLHALTISAYSPAEWAESPAALSSPPCLGGSKAGAGGH